MQARTKAMAATLIACAASFCAPVMAQSTWSYASFTEATGAGSNNEAFGNSYSTVTNGTKLTVSAFGQGSGSAFSSAYIGNYGTGSGFGVKNQTEGMGISSPQHSMDNSVGIDMLALHFTNSGSNADVSVVMTQLTTGWHNTAAVSTCGSNGTTLCGTDSDVSLLRWAGAGTPTILAGTTSSLLGAGWQLVNNYADMADDVGRSTGLNASSTGSSWWLISAYSSAWGGGGANLSDGDDFVKVLSSITTVPTGGGTNGTTVPEPGSLALVAAALLGAVASQRRGKRN